MVILYWLLSAKVLKNGEPPNNYSFLLYQSNGKPAIICTFAGLLVTTKH